MFKTRKKLKITLIAFVVIFIVIRMVAPAIILKQLNAHLAQFSDTYKIHIGDLDIGLFRLHYRFQDVKGTLKKNNEEFLSIDSLDVSLAWRELLFGRVLTDIDTYNAKIVITKQLFESSTWKNEETKKERLNEAKDVRETLFPVDVERATLRESTIQLTEELNIPLGDRVVLSDLDATIINLTPTDRRPVTLASADGTIQGSATLKAAAHLKMLKKPLDWDLDAAINSYELSTANSVLKRMIPLTFKKGRADIYAEVKSEEGQMRGYVKPFLKDMAIMGDNGDFTNIKHFLIELVGTIANALLKDPKTQTFATQINFSQVNGKFEIDTGEAFDKAVEHSGGDRLAPALNNTIQLNNDLNNDNERKTHE